MSQRRSALQVVEGIDLSWAAVNPALAGRGALYLEDCAISRAVAPYACDEQRAADFWELSEQLCARRA
ncbi:hypothetical protein [Mycobacterium simiae]|uniref:hypothetical protein n=1 Tax=Mycobacterium simiae TaxID=1784 RepID=UPI0003F5FDC4|nr:hypothetical protein X011_03590 [Mycobacterium tuberculosis variant microti OV254]BBX40373.1 hypothetical protein MSIM_18240 [Mycobacterium simiae]